MVLRARLAKRVTEKLAGSDFVEFVSILACIHSGKYHSIFLNNRVAQRSLEKFSAVRYKLKRWRFGKFTLLEFLFSLTIISQKFQR